MFQPALPEVFTADEVARAAGVPRQAVATLLAAGELRPIGDSQFIAGSDAIMAARRLRAAAAASVVPPPDTLFTELPETSDFARRERRVPTIATGTVHAVVLALLLWATAGSTDSASNSPAPEPSRLVFLVTPGPGGGGGGGGTRNPHPAPRLERTGPKHSTVSVPVVKPDPVLTTARNVDPPPKPTPAAIPEAKPVERAPEPLPAKVLVAPVVETAAATRDREGVIENPRGDADSHGAGDGGGSGTGQGTGNGQGAGSGIGEGSGGGTGGGPFRPGSGIEPPRLLHEVKAEFTEEARRRNISGDVVLEIVVTRDGGVGDVKVLQGLGAGLDQRAIAAVRQWRFAPALRRGQPVDVIVQVAVEFTLR